MMSDLIEDPQAHLFRGLLAVSTPCTPPNLKWKERAAAYGVFMAAAMLLFATGMPMGYVLPRGMALAISVTAGIAKLVYLFLVFPETARKAERASTVEPNPLRTMTSACSLLAKNAFAKRLACVLVFTGIGSAGYGVVLPPFMMGYLGYTRKDKLVLMCIAAASALVAFACLMGPLVRAFGQVRTLQFCLIASACVPLLTAACQDQLQLDVLTPLLVSPTVLAIPLFSALKSAVVSSQEQGLIQGAVASMSKAGGVVNKAQYVPSAEEFGWL
ncbi:tyr-3 [Symbiodinium natans]|uniref:Tyr-3 protein n=1 Tax=Symbiodinium natans TaxID=878477 RepID=A0A812JGY4_9DINO|nr:tyr-3 [Symbiodinium natans]